MDLHVCLSHWRRRKIALAKQKEAAKGKACIEVPESDDPAYPLFLGTKLVGNCTNGKFTNGARYVVKDILAGATVLLEDTGKQIQFETTLDAISKNTILAWALTYQKVQGITEEGTIMLHDLTSKNFKKCHLYVGLSRPTNGRNLFVA